MYAHGFVVANEGNLTVRLDEDRILCTPTLQSKGFMTPDDLCIIDMTGTQIEGRRRRSSEALLHLEIYRQRSDVVSVVHSHPPHATTFAVAGEAIPVGILPEVEVLLGEVGLAPYGTPGTQALADSIAPFVAHSRVILLANHGVVSFGSSPEEAYWCTEVLEKYCRILLDSRALGGPQYLSPREVRELLEQKAAWGIPDPRTSPEYAEADLHGNAVFHHTWDASRIGRRAFPPPAC